MSAPFSGLPIVMFSMSRFDHLSSASLAIAKELSKTNIVFYVDMPYTFKDDLKLSLDEKYLLRKQKRKNKIDRIIEIDGFPNLKVVVPNLILPINFLPKGIIYHFFQAFNDYLVCSSVLRVLQKQGLVDYILYNSFNPFFGWWLKRKVPPKATIYQCRDDISAAPYVNKHGPTMEKDWIKKADVSIATSKQLVKKLSEYGREVCYVPNAADVELFNSAVNVKLPRPKEISGISGHKIIGYTGLVGERMDLQLVKEIALAHQDKVLVMVGPIDSNYIGESFDGLNNIMLIGSKPYEELPAWLQYFDVCIIPFLKNELTKSIYPLKINEYLAAGKPVVATNFSEDVRIFNNVAILANNHRDFILNIGQALIDDNEELKTERLMFSTKNSWAARVSTIDQLMTKSTL